MLCGGGGTGAAALAALKTARAVAGRGGDVAQIASILDGVLATGGGGGSGGSGGGGGALAEEMAALQGMLEDTGSRGVQLGSGMVEGVTLAKKMALTNSMLREVRYSYRRLVRTRPCAPAPVHALTRACMHACNSRVHVRRIDAELSLVHAPRPTPWPWSHAWPLHASSTRTRTSSQPVHVHAHVGLRCALNAARGGATHARRADARKWMAAREDDSA